MLSSRQWLPTIGVTHILYINLSADTSECIGMQDISLAGFACREDEIAREEHWPLRSHVLVGSVFRSQDVGANPLPVVTWEKASGSSRYDPIGPR